MTLLKKIRSALYEVIDPELGVNIMDLGLIYNIELDEDHNVYVKMTLTTPGCPMSDSITNGVKYRISQIEEIGTISVDLVWEPRWTPLNMSDRCKERLGWA